MDLIDAIKQRKSIRAFKPAAVPLQVLKEIMEIALRAPSWSNTQPWEFAIVCGGKLDEIKQAFVQKADEPPNFDLAAPRDFPGDFDTRRRSLSRTLYEVKGISREDKEKRREWQLQGLRLFDAPCAVYIYTERSFYFQNDRLNVWPVFDCGLVAQTIMLLATGYGLGTIPQIQSVSYPDVLRKALEIPDTKLILMGIAVGYPERDDPVNRFRSEREPLEKVTRWYGFD